MLVPAQPPRHGDELAEAIRAARRPAVNRPGSAARPQALMGLLSRDRLPADLIAPLRAAGSIPERRRHRQVSMHLPGHAARDSRPPGSEH
jgi:hypothetical protein